MTSPQQAEKLISRLCDGIAKSFNGPIVRGSYPVMDISTSSSYVIVGEQVASSYNACIRNVTGSNLGRDTDYPDRGFAFLLSHTKRMPGQYLEIGHDRSVRNPC
jgi:hypothetical protein